MRKSIQKRRSKVQFSSKAALVRLAILLSVLLILTVWLWLTSFWMPGKSYAGQLPSLQQEEVTLREQLRQDVQSLSEAALNRKKSQYDRLNAKKAFLDNALTQAGYPVTRQDYQVDGKTYTNLIVEKRGTEHPNEVIIIGAHYDAAFTSPGANDNATGAAATLELAKRFAEKSPKRTVRFVEFTNEEPPFFWTQNMGSLVYAKQINPQKENVVAMLSLETMGYFSDTKGSQQYPFPLNLLYPNQGNFISFIGNLNSGDLVRRSIESFRSQTQFPSEGVSLPDGIPGVGWSDQWSFWQQGYKGIMVTDTAPYRYPYYHTIDDTIDKIDFDKLTRVVSGLSSVISDLAA